MEQFLDFENWPRKSQFNFFKDFDRPCFNVTAPVDVTQLYEVCKQQGQSFFLASLYITIRAANTIEGFRYRLRGDRILIHEEIHPSSTILNPDHTFGFCYFKLRPTLREFLRDGDAAVAAYHLSPGLKPQPHRDDLIHYSVLPWINFTGFTHAYSSKSRDDIPKIVIGKYSRQQDRLVMPLSVEVHHSLMDGYHMGLYFQEVEGLLARVGDLFNPETLAN